MGHSRRGKSVRIKFKRRLTTRFAGVHGGTEGAYGTKKKMMWQFSDREYPIKKLPHHRSLRENRGFRCPLGKQNHSPLFHERCFANFATGVPARLKIRETFSSLSHPPIPPAKRAVNSPYPPMSDRAHISSVGGRNKSQS